VIICILHVFNAEVLQSLVNIHNAPTANHTHYTLALYRTV